MLKDHLNLKLMKLKYFLFIILFLNFGCRSENKELATELCRQATYSMGGIGKFDNIDSLDYALELINKALEYDSNNDYIYLTKAQNYFYRGEEETAFKYLLKSWEISNQNYNTGLYIGCYYEKNNDTISAQKYYNEALISVNNSDTTDVFNLLNKKGILKLLNKEVDFYDLIMMSKNHRDSDYLEYIIPIIEKASRQELVEMITNM